MSNALTSVDTWITFARVITLIGALLFLAWTFNRWRRTAERDTQRIFEQLDLIRADLLMMKDAMQHTVQRVDSAAKQVAHDVRLAPAQTGTASRGYEIAARLAKNGASKEELVKSCGITAPEAELLVRLHAPRQTGNQASNQAAQAAATPAPQTTAPRASTAAPKSAEARGLERIAELGRQMRSAPTPAQPNQHVAPTPAPAQRTAKQRSRLVAVG